MGMDPGDPWIHLQRQYSKLAAVSNNDLPSSRQWSNSQSMLPAYMNLHGSTTSGIMPSRSAASKFVQMNSALNLPINPVDAPTGAAAQKRFLIFDQSGSRTSLIFSSVSPPIWNSNSTYPKQKAPSPFHIELPVNHHLVNRSDEINTSDESDRDEMHEDTEEIDALLYSDSEDDEATSTGHSPVKTLASDEEVASSGLPTKRRRLNEDIDAALADTASSASVCGCQQMECRYADDYDELSLVKGLVQGGGAERDISRTNVNSKRLKRDRISETVGVLRRIVPGGKGKDTAMILDKAIRYLRFLKLKAKVSGAAV